MPDQEDPRCWIIQRCTQKFTGTTLEYETWTSYDTPMTHTEMLAALELCEKLWPEHEFRGHRISPGTSEQGTTPGSLTKSGEPGIFREGQ